MQNISTIKSLNVATHQKQQNNHPSVKEGAKPVQVQNEAEITESPATLAKRQLNNAILQSNRDVSISAGNEPMALLFKAAIDGINEVLEAELGEKSIQQAYESGLDVSPEATADRIVSMSTAFFSQYQDKNPELSDEEAAKYFADIIAGGIEKGFTEAREILDGLNVLEGDIASNIDETFGLVQQGLLTFVESFSGKKEMLTNE